MCISSQDVFSLFFWIDKDSQDVSPRSHLLAVVVLWWTLPDNYSLHSWPDWAGWGGLWALHGNGRMCSDATGRPAAVGAASQAVPVRAALGASAAAILIVGHWRRERNMGMYSRELKVHYVVFWGRNFAKMRKILTGWRSCSNKLNKQSDSVFMSNTI